MPIMVDRFKLNSLSLHYAYFILTPLIVSVIFYTCAHHDDLHYIDALFMCFCAITGTGLNVLDLSTLNSLQQGILFALLVLGHSIPIFGVLSLVRAWTLRSALKSDTEINNVKKATEDMDKQKATATVTELPQWLPSPNESDGFQKDYGFITVVEQTRSGHSERATPDTIVSSKNTRSNAKLCILRVASRLRSMMRLTGKHLKSRSSIDYNQPGGLEYLAVSLISALVVIYFIGFLCLGIVGVGIWSHVFRPDIAHADGVSAFWGGAFLATSAFCNNGMSLIATNMGPFQREAFPLLVSGFLVLAGNTLFPCLLRLFIWTIRKVLPNQPTWESWRRALDYALAQSNNICDYLYPSWHTWFLLGTVISLNCIMWAAFEISAIHNEEIGALPPKYRVLDGLFQALSVRGGGFSIVAFDRLPQGLLILYALMMYLSAFPVSTTISSLEAYKRSCLKASHHRDDFYEDDFRPTSIDGPRLSHFARGRFVYQQLHSQFSNDMWWLCLAVLLITVAESNNYKSDPMAFSTFNIIFEVISAYSCVGESIGYPGKSYAFCGEWHTFSKLLLIAVSLRGKIRSLPIVVDSINGLQKEALQKSAQRSKGHETQV